MSEKKEYWVQVPIAGHLSASVEASSEEEAKRLAMELDIDDPNVDVSWEMLDKFHQGNVCFCPSPWEIEVGEE